MSGAKVPRATAEAVRTWRDAPEGAELGGGGHMAQLDGGEVILLRLQQVAQQVKISEGSTIY